MWIFTELRLTGPIPDGTTILNFCHFLEQNRHCKKLFETINSHLAEHGLVLKEGTIIAAPFSAKNERDLGVEEHVTTDAGYTGMEKGEEHLGRNMAYKIAMRPG